MSSYILAVTGASGTIYGKRLVEVLLSKDHRVKLLISKPGEEVLAHELDFQLEGDEKEKERRLKEWLGLKYNDPSLEYIDYLNFSAPICSGSCKTDGMIIIPCSMSTVAGVAQGISSNLIQRAADVMLKERRPLILVPRETPLNEIHLRNMLILVQAGAFIVPAMPGFYHRPQNIDDLVDFIVGRVLDILGIEHDLYPPWGG
ncbi:MAG: flavin prenyltransferase UbiX [Actinomycetota bacterium]